MKFWQSIKEKPDFTSLSEVSKQKNCYSLSCNAKDFSPSLQSGELPVYSFPLFFNFS